MKKKVTTTLLMTSVLSGILNTPAFASTTYIQKNITDNFNEKYNTSLCKINSRINDETRFKEVTYKNDKQHFFGLGFQSFHEPYVIGNMKYGYISSISDSEFKVRTGFFDVNGKLYYSDSTGNSAMGLTKLEDGIYYFNPNFRDPCAVRGWKDVDGQKYYFNTTFRATTGISEILEKCFYYFDKDGRLQVGLQKVGGKTYYFAGKGGRAALGWCNVGSNRYYFDDMDRGAAVTGWYKTPKGNVFFNEDGTMVRGIKKIGNDWYLFKSTGSDQNAYKTTGFYTDEYTVSKDRYYFNPNDGGKAVKGWHTYLNGEKMYFNNDGIMQKGVTKIGDDYYLFLSSNSDWNAYQKFGWFTDKTTNHRYYFNPSDGGKAVKGVQTIEGKRYYFDNNGVLQ